MRFELHPDGADDRLPLGKAPERAEAWLASLGEPAPFRRGPDSPPGMSTTRASGLAIFLELDAGGTVRSIEFGRPDDDADEVTVDGIDVFGPPADEVVARIRERTEVREEDGGRTATFDAYTVSLWRPTLPEGPGDEDGRVFESALVGVEGYFEGKASAGPG